MHTSTLNELRKYFPFIFSAGKCLLVTIPVCSYPLSVYNSKLGIQLLRSTLLNLATGFSFQKLT